MTALNVLWWLGWAYFATWVALPLVGAPITGTLLGFIVWVLVAPWSALLGMAALHRLFPQSDTGTFTMFSDRGSVRWAVKGWAPSVYLTVFQPLFFLSPAFQRIALWAFQAKLAPGAVVTSRTSIREPHHVRIGRSTVIGEFVHLACSYQPRPKVLVVGKIDIGDDVLVGAYSHVAAGARIGSRTIVEHAVVIGPNTTVGDDVRIGAGAALYNRVRVGNGARIGKGCIIGSGVVVPAGVRIPDGTVVSSSDLWQKRRQA